MPRVGNELVKALAEDQGITKAKSHHAVRTLFRTMREAILRNDKVVITRFGTFHLRKGSQCNYIYFRPGQALIQEVGDEMGMPVGNFQVRDTRTWYKRKTDKPLREPLIK